MGFLEALNRPFDVGHRLALHGLADRARPGLLRRGARHGAARRGGGAGRGRAAGAAAARRAAPHPASRRGTGAGPAAVVAAIGAALAGARAAGRAARRGAGGVPRHRRLRLRTGQPDPGRAARPAASSRRRRERTRCAAYPAAELLAGLRGKDVLFVFVESYGRVAVEDPTISPGVNAVLDEGIAGARRTRGSTAGAPS